LPKGGALDVVMKSVRNLAR
jgi:hypothetical protein